MIAILLLWIHPFFTIQEYRFNTQTIHRLEADPFEALIISDNIDVLKIFLLCNFNSLQNNIFGKKSCFTIFDQYLKFITLLNDTIHL